LKIDRTTFFALVTTLAGAGACSSSSPSGSTQTTDAGSDGPSSSGGDGGVDSGKGGDSGIPCPVSPCIEGAVCVTDPSTGNKACAQTCASSSACPPANGCCTVVPGLVGGACEPSGSWNGQQCLCSTGPECSQTGHAGSTSSCCAPLADATNNPIGPKVCKPNDGKAYDCAATTVVNPCPAGFCVGSNTGNGAVCMEPCTGQSQCANGAVCTPLTSGSCNSSPMVCWPSAE
jgi:hypothetical protein